VHKETVKMLSQFFFAEHLNINKVLIQNTQLNKCTHKYIQHHLNLVQIIVVIPNIWLLVH